MSPYTQEVLEELKKENAALATQRKWFIIINIVAALSMAIFFALLLNDRAKITREANIRATQIQQQRYDTVYGNCIDQNMRHDHTIHRLKIVLARYVKKHPDTKAQAAASLKQNEFLIEGIVPRHNDCKAVARKAVHPLVNPNGR